MLDAGMRWEPTRALTTNVLLELVPIVKLLSTVLDADKVVSPRTWRVPLII